LPQELTKSQQIPAFRKQGQSGTVCVVYNGEIYNFQPLMAELARLGHIFRTR